MRNFELDDNRYYKARLGLIVLQSDETIEQEFRTILDQSVSINHSRIYCDNIVSNKNLRLMEKELPAASALLPDIQYDSIGYACTSGATVIGSDKIESLINKKHKSAFVTDPIRAVKKAMNTLGCRKINFVSPYQESVTKSLRDHLHANNFIIQNQISFNETDDKNVARISDKDSLEAILEVGKQDCEAVFISCTNLKTFKIINEAEKVLDKPVVSSNQAISWQMLREAGINSTAGPGILFSKH